jgi:methylated-DNA-protein-cysteine methyltransferase-like protein
MSKKSPFAERIITLIRSIPKGKVATYGQIATMAGNSRGVRGVVWLLHSSSNKKKLPWHRVINRHGRISLQPGFGLEEQRFLLESEGIIFNPDSSINLELYLWNSD